MKFDASGHYVTSVERKAAALSASEPVVLRDAEQASVEWVWDMEHRPRNTRGRTDWRSGPDGSDRIIIFLRSLDRYDKDWALILGLDIADYTAQELAQVAVHELVHSVGQVGHTGRHLSQLAFNKVLATMGHPIRMQTGSRTAPGRTHSPAPVSVVEVEGAIDNAYMQASGVVS